MTASQHIRRAKQLLLQADNSYKLWTAFRRNKNLVEAFECLVAAREHLVKPTVLLQDGYNKLHVEIRKALSAVLR